MAPTSKTIDLAESVAGEEDPGAGIDTTLVPAGDAPTRAGRLAYAVSGQGEAKLVLLNGAGVGLEGWRALYPRIEAMGRVFAWNRPGLQGSDPPSGPLHGRDVIAALRELLAHAGFEPPYVLVGHSMGCLYADLFARLYPGETRAVLLLAPTHAADPEALKRKELPFGRAISRLLEVPEGEISANLHGELAALDDTLQQLAAAGPFPDVPVALVDSGQGHFPQLTDPDGVLRELALLLARA